MKGNKEKIKAAHLFKSFTELSNNSMPKSITTFGINHITHQILIGTETILKLYSSITHKKLNLETAYQYILLK